jgi:hypothetical protein
VPTLSKTFKIRQKSSKKIETSKNVKNNFIFVKKERQKKEINKKIPKKLIFDVFLTNLWQNNDMEQTVSKSVNWRQIKSVN